MTRQQLQTIAQAERAYNMGLIPAWQYYRAIVDSYPVTIPQWELDRIDAETKRIH